ncbi:MAG: DUF4082 domain-containing protein, partial [Thermoplasmata archaeon]|nr:DUF4082 domain-containing protein [Thermoplasmata archaeon]
MRETRRKRIFVLFVSTLLLASTLTILPPPSSSTGLPTDPENEPLSPGLETWNTTSAADFQEGTLSDIQLMDIGDGAIGLAYDEGTRGGSGDGMWETEGTGKEGLEERADGEEVLQTEGDVVETEGVDEARTDTLGGDEDTKEGTVSTQETQPTGTRGGTRGAQHGDILILHGPTSAQTSVTNILTSAGYTVTDGGVLHTYTGTPDPNDYGAVILLLGDYNTVSETFNDAGEAALLNYVQNGGGIVVTEWFAYQIQTGGRFNILRSIQCLSRSGGGTASETYSTIATENPHPVTDGLPTSFVTPVAGYSIMSTTTIASARAIMGGSSSQRAVGIREYGSGKVVHLTTAGIVDGVNNPWNDGNMQKLLVNSANWVRAPEEPKIRPNIHPPAVDEDNNIVMDLSQYEYDQDEMGVFELFHYNRSHTASALTNNHDERGICVTMQRDMEITKIGWYADIPGQTLLARVYELDGAGVRVDSFADVHGILNTTGSTGYSWHDIPLNNTYTLLAGQKYEISVYFGDINGWSYISKASLPMPYTQNGFEIFDFRMNTSVNSFCPFIRVYINEDNAFSSTRHFTTGAAGGYTLGWSFTPSEDITVNSVRHYFGTKVSIWTDGGALLAWENVNSIDGQWNETRLSTPLTLTGGQTYRITAY